MTVILPNTDITKYFLPMFYLNFILKAVSNFIRNTRGIGKTAVFIYYEGKQQIVSVLN